MRPTLYFLAGSTASGKTALALRWAESHGAEILSCDAFCVYRGMDIGTAKPSAEEMSRVRHYGIDITNPNESFSVGAYAAYADRVVREVCTRGTPLLITGGSGFYLKSFFSPTTDEVEIPGSLRQAVLGLHETHGLPPLLDRLDLLNPHGTGTLDRSNPRRVINALLRCEASGLPLEALAARFKQLPLPFSDFNKRVCLIERDAGELSNRVLLRTQTMIADGLVDEVRNLRQEGFECNPTAASAIGYRETLAHLDGEGDLKWLEQTITTHTMQLIKKQRTWFKRQIPIEKIISIGPGNEPDPMPLFD